MPRAKSLILFTVLIDVVGLGIIIPVLPFFVSSFGISPLTITSLIAVYAFCSFFSNPVLGAISDRYGRKPVLFLSLLSTSIGWFVFASAHNVFQLFLGRVIDGLAAGNISTAQGYLVDLAKDEKERTTNLGYIGALFGLGFVIGPFIGGVLSAISPNFPFLFVGFLALVNAIISWKYLPESNINHRTSGKISINPFVPLKRAVLNKPLWPSFASWFFFGMAAFGMQSILAIYFKDVLHFSSFLSGMVITIMGVVLVINQGLALKHFWLKRFKVLQLELWLLLLCVVGFIFMGSWFPIIFFLGVFITTFSQGVLRAIMNSITVGSADPQRRGEVLGTLTALSDMASIFGPLIAGFLFQTHLHLPFFVSALFCLIAFFVVFFGRRKQRATVTV
ncbi:MAG: MFS transporter [Patescibacteria group bacterium]|jgi:DHA1 family tetracycline resistance protein-like MFS transporter